MTDLKVDDKDDLMIVFSLTLEEDAQNWFYDLFDEAIDSVAGFFEKFLLRWHEGTVDDIEQLDKQCNALLPRTHHEEAQEEIHEEHSEDERGHLEENIIDNLMEEAIQVTLVEVIIEELLDIAIIEKIEDVDFPQAYEQLYDEGLDLPKFHFIEDNNSCFAGLPHENPLDDRIQLEEGLPTYYLSPLQHYVDPVWAR